jgi:glyoxylase-like metal-dependent hydrolase (beta-lactamase superfamily II)
LSGDLAALGVKLVRADNPGPMTLSGTNTWITGGWIVDPGPLIGAHQEAVAAAAGRAEGIALTHDHADHAEGVDALRALVGDVPVVHAPRDGEVFGPLRALALPGHADDHVAYVAGRVAFTGDAVLGEGSVFVAGQLTRYLEGLRRLRDLGLAVLCPGHGPPIWDAGARLDGYVAHRLDRERRLLAALESGLRSEPELLDAVWDDAPAELRPFAAVTLRAHMQKLRDEGRA